MNKTKFYIKSFSTIIFFVVTLLLYLYTDVWHEYKDLHQNRAEYEAWLDLTSDKIEEFSFEKLEDFEDTRFYATPDLDLLDTIVSKIDTAKEKVYLETYILTEKRVKSALKKAHKRGVDVKVILEQNPYKANTLNNKAYNELKDAGVNVIWDGDNYALTHTKMLLIDDEVIIWTGNYSYSTFKYNRDMFIVSKDKELLKKAYKLFEIDFSKKKWLVYDDGLVLSPYYSRNKLNYMLDNAKEDVVFYAQNFSDKETLEKLINLQNLWINVSWVISAKNDLGNDDEISKMKEVGIEIYDLTSPKIHAKALLIDKKYLYIWSVNYSYYSIDKNRELWLIITNKDIIDEFLKVYEKDVKKFVKSR